MPELYLFLVSLVAISAITMRRHFIVKQWRKITLKKKAASRVEALKQEEQTSPVTRFKEDHTEEQKKQKFNFVQYKEFMRKAEMATAKRHFAETKSFLIQALSCAREETPVLMQLASVYLESGDAKRAEALYQKLLETTPMVPKIYESLGRIQAQKKQYKEAIRFYVQAVELDPKNDALLLSLGKLYRLLMRPSLAGECFRQAAELKPREVNILFLLAETCMEDDDHDNALFTYEKILTLEPYNEKASQAAQMVRLKMKETEILFRNFTSPKIHARS